MPKITMSFSRIWSGIAADVLRRKIVDSGKNVYETKEGVKTNPEDWTSRKVAITSDSNLETSASDDGVKRDFPRSGTQEAFS
jgi:hypothetical protein